MSIARGTLVQILLRRKQNVSLSGVALKGKVIRERIRTRKLSLLEPMVQRG
jgi:hypothetical protein